MKTHILIFFSVAIISGCATGPSREEIARAKAQEIRVQKRMEAARIRQEKVERAAAAWHAAEQANNYDGYQEYLKQFPGSIHESEGQTRLVGLEREKARDSFRVIKATITEKEQSYLGGYRITGNTPQSQVQTGKPKSGEVFVIIEWSLGDFCFREGDFQFYGKELDLLVDGQKPDAGCSIWPVITDDKIVYAWRDAENVSQKIARGESIHDRRLFNVKKENSHNLKLRFMGKEYLVDAQPE